MQATASPWEESIIWGFQRVHHGVSLCRCQVRCLHRTWQRQSETPWWTRWLSHVFGIFAPSTPWLYHDIADDGLLGNRPSSGMSWYSRSMDLLDISGCHFSTKSSCNCVVTDPIWAWTEKYCVIPACGNVGVCSSVIWRGIRRNPWARLPLAPQLSRHFWGSYTVCIPPHETRVIICHSFRQRWNIALSKTIHSASHSHTITSEKYRVMRACRNHWQEGSSFWDPDHQSKGPNDWAKMARKFNL